MNWSDSSGKTSGILIVVVLCILDKKIKNIPAVVIHVGNAGMWIIWWLTSFILWGVRCIFRRNNAFPRDFWISSLISGFPDITDSSVGKESACSARDPSSIPGSGRYAGEGKGCPLQYSGLENSMDCTVHGVAKSWTRWANFTSQEISENS